MDADRPARVPGDPARSRNGDLLPSLSLEPLLGANLMPTRIELEAEIRRLNEALAIAESREGPSSNDIGVVGRVAITRLRDTDYPEQI